MGNAYNCGLDDGELKAIGENLTYLPTRLAHVCAAMSGNRRSFFATKFTQDPGLPFGYV